MTPVGEIYYFATLTRIVTIILGVLSYTWTKSYDTSTDLILPTNTAYNHLHFLNIFVRWDAVYFLHIAEHGYVYEQETAFFPLLPYVSNYLSQTVFMPLQQFVGRQYTIVIVGALITNLSFVLAAGYLYKLTRLIYPGDPKLAKYSTVAFCLSLPSMFMSAFYTESVFALLSFMGMYHFHKQRYLLASILWGLASLARSNAIVYVGFFIYEFIICRYQQQSLKSLISGTLQAMFYSLITVSGFTGFQYSLYLTYCDQTSTFDQRPWCTNLPPLVYSFVQKEYWGNGFLAYYELKQIPNFLLAMPIIGLSVGGLYLFITKDWIRWLTLGQVNHGSSGERSFTSNKATVYMYLWAFLLLYTVTCMHVQVILRFFTSLPPLYWYIGYLWSHGLRCSSEYQGWIANGIFYYSVLYGLVGIILFSAFLPPA
ncbi:GPI mannosyltransferase 2 [Chlamydoabsidia padenii]|nr:GPI mannosyltransferase 2 [Chlamydoabsidia padenii]